MIEPAGTPQAAPYKAYQSYGPADGDLFFGRDAEGVALARWFQDHPFAVLTSPSGVGKTSLLNARVLPLLEQQHWSTVYCRPEADPHASLRRALCEHMFPKPRDEARVAARLLAATKDPTIDLQHAIDWFKVLPLRERIASRLFAVAEDGGEKTADFAALPVLARALRGSLSCGDVVEHFEALVAEGAPLGLTGQTPLTEVIRLLEQAETANLCDQWVSQLGREANIADMLDVLDDQWLALKPGTAGVFLIVDQFEEVFTRLPPGTIGRFMDHVGAILARRGKPTRRPHAKPINIAVSMRKEFLADLLPHLRRLGLRDVTYQLELMTKTAAELAVARPSALFRMNFSASAVNRILAYALDDAAHGNEAAEDDLPEEARYSPALISIYGAYLWQRHAPPVDDGPTLPVDADDLPRLESAFAGYLENSLQKIEESGANSFAALELLARLVIGGEFRNIVPQRELARRWPLKKGEFDSLLELLDGKVKLIRRERRGRDDMMVEIMHERLIRPARSALDALSRQQPIRARLPLAYELLAIAPDDALVTTDPMPAAVYRDCLLHFLEQCELDPLKAKTLLRSVMAADREGPRSDDEGIRWQRAVEYLAQVMTRPVDESSPARTDALPTGRRLDSGLDRLYAGGDFDEAAFRRILQGALSDVGRQAGERVARAFGYLVGKGGAQELVRSALQRLQASTAADRMMPTVLVLRIGIPVGERLEDVAMAAVADMFERVDRNGRKVTRLLFVDHNGYCVAIMNRSLWLEMLATGARLNPPVDIARDRLAKVLYQSYTSRIGETFAHFMTRTFAFVGASQTVADALAAMEAMPQCQDVVVTQEGSPSEAMLGWITSTDIARLSKGSTVETRHGAS